MRHLSMKHTLLAITTAALLSPLATGLSASDAEACLPPIENIVQTIPESGGTIGAEGRLFFRVENAEFNEDNLTFSSEAGEPVRFELIRAGSFFATHLMIVPTQPLEAGAYTLTRTPGDWENDLTPQEFIFNVDPNLEKPELRIDQVLWRRAQFTEPVSPNNCVGEILEQSTLDITIPFWGAGDIVVHVAMEDETGEVINESLSALNQWHNPAALEPPPMIRAGFSLWEKSTCTAVTAYHTSGAVSETTVQCDPYYCATLTPEEYGYGPVADDAYTLCNKEETGDDFDHVDDDLEENVVNNDHGDDTDGMTDDTGGNQDGGWNLEDNGENSSEIEDGCQSVTGGAAGGLPGAGLWIALGLLLGLRRRERRSATRTSS